MSSQILEMECCRVAGSGNVREDLCRQVVEDLVDVFGIVEATYSGCLEYLVINVLAIARKPSVVS
jgi:hypothetical protein